MFHADRFSAVGGVGYTATARKVLRVSHTNGYLYSYLKHPINLTWTFGISFDSIQVDGIGDFDQPNPKFGLVWRATPSTTVRLAAFRTRGRDLLTETIEPTQVAGFNQFFDDPIATETRRYGIAVDHKFGMGLYGGLKFSARELLRKSSNKIDWDERTYRTYIDWAVTSRIAAKLAYEVEDFGRAAPSEVPETQTTHLAEAGLRFFDPSGVFSHVEAKYINQKAGEPPFSLQNQFVVVDAGVGYRLPKRFGIAALQLNNLFDEDFRFQSFGNRTPLEGEKVENPPPFFPERTVFASFTLAL